jgi:hypothetical protein
MIEPVKSPAPRVLSKGRRALWLVVSLTFAALIFAAAAQARGTNVTEAATEAAIGEAATESGASLEQAPPTTEQAPPATETAPPTVAQAPPVAGEAPPAAEQAPPTAAETPPTTEQTPPTAAETPPAAEQTPPLTAEATPPTTETAPPPTEQAPPVVEQAPPVAETTPPTVEHVPPVAEIAPPAEKKTVEQAAGGVTAGAGSEGQRTDGSSQASGGPSAPSHNEAADEVAPGDSIAATASTTPDVRLEIPTVDDQPSLASSSQTISVHRARQASCESATLGASIVAGDAGNWLDLAAATSVSATNFAADDTSPNVITTGAPGGNQDGGSAIETHPPTPAPGPGPGGAGGGAAAGGSSGSTSSASFTLVGALVQAAPRAIRRFRLAQPSWRTSFFVLIPERPD